MENRKGMWYTIEKYIAQEAHMEYQKLDEMYLLRAERGEELLTCIGELCEKEKITAGFVMGIGAVGTVEMGLFKTAEKRYISRELQGDFEIGFPDGKHHTDGRKALSPSAHCGGGRGTECAGRSFEPRRGQRHRGNRDWCPPAHRQAADFPGRSA